MTEIELAALAWHTANAHRLEISAEKRKIDKALKEAGYDLRLSIMQSDAAARLTPAKQRELAALRKLAKACAAQRGHLARVDVIDVDVRFLVAPDGLCDPL